MLKEIIQSCCTGFGDCVVGYVSTYLLKKQIERLYSLNSIRIRIKWCCVDCPYINTEHIFSGHIGKRDTASVNCLFSGEDGTLAFTRYYKSPRMSYDINHKTHLRVTINQYIGKCLIDDQVSRSEVKRLTYEAYEYFWNNVLQQSSLKKIIRDVPGDEAVIYVRLGDEYLCGKSKDVEKPLIRCYDNLKQIKDECNLSKVALIGDIDNRLMNEVYLKHYGEWGETVELSGSVGHSGTHLSEKEWEKIFIDLNLLLNAREVVILSNWSNFVRVVLFLNHKQNRKIYFMRDDKLSRVTDLSTIFSKHYKF